VLLYGAKRLACAPDHLGHRGQIARMAPAVDPAQDAGRVDSGGTRQLPTVAQFGRAPVLRKAGSAVFATAFLQIVVGEKSEQREIGEAHGAIAALVFVADAARGRAVLPAKGVGFFLCADGDENDAQIGAIAGSVELTQLRERFAEKRSTDVAQPDDQCRKLDA
jgi:hypothetical protein